MTEYEAYAIANLIDDTLFDEIRNDTEINNLQWLGNLIHGYEKLCKFSGYEDLAEELNADFKSKSRSFTNIYRNV